VLLHDVLCRKNGYELSYNQEIVGLGIANFAGAMFSSYTTTGSFSRSAVNNSSGASGSAYLVACAAQQMWDTFSRCAPKLSVMCCVIDHVVCIVETLCCVCKRTWAPHVCVVCWQQFAMVLCTGFDWLHLFVVLCCCRC
jgi:hypothetical protein